MQKNTNNSISKSITIKTLKELKSKGEKFSALTAYDATFANVADNAGIDVLLVGDSLGMVIQGRDTTVPVNVDDIVYHGQSVARGSNRSLRMIDMPFLGCADISSGIANAAKLMQQGCGHIIKIETGLHHLDLIKILVNNGVPVCAHIGLLPQNVNKLGGYFLTGKTDDSADILLEQALRLQDIGVDILLLECVSSNTAKRITESVEIPVIGIGSGRYTDGQILVMYDILGMSSYIPKFAKNFLAETNSIEQAIKNYDSAVKQSLFPE